MQKKILQFFIRICQFNFGTFEEEEFKKFLRMGLIFALITGVYWALRPLKDAIFMQLVDKMYLPYAKTISVLLLFPLVMFYTKLLGKFSREKMLIMLPTCYGIAILFFSVVISAAQSTPKIILANSSVLPFLIKTLGYIWYTFVESFGSLMVALFWAFAADTTEPLSAKRGFPLIVAIGQVGGAIFPYLISGLPYRLGLNTDALSMVTLGSICLCIIPLVKYFLRVTSADFLIAFNQKEEKEKQKIKPGFLEGLNLMLSHRYLIGIFSLNFIYEFIITIFDFNFKMAAGTVYVGVALSNYLSIYASSVNIVSLLCLLLGISNITRFLGIGVTLLCMPFIVGAALFGFLTLDSLPFLFALMVGSKALNYALNGPALKQLYIPTTTDVRFKAQAWIETFGSRASKEAGSLFNMLLHPFQSIFGVLAGRSYYLVLSGFIGFPLLALWFVIALYLGRNFRNAIDTKKVVC